SKEESRPGLGRHPLTPSATWRPPKGGPWLCVPASRRVCPFEDEEVLRGFTIRGARFPVAAACIPKTACDKNLCRVGRAVKSPCRFLQNCRVFAQKSLGRLRKFTAFFCLRRRPPGGIVEPEEYGSPTVHARDVTPNRGPRCFDPPGGVRASPWSWPVSCRPQA